MSGPVDVPQRCGRCGTVFAEGDSVDDVGGIVLGEDTPTAVVFGFCRTCSDARRLECSGPCLLCGKPVHLRQAADPSVELGADTITDMPVADGWDVRPVDRPVCGGCYDLLVAGSGAGRP